jgi:hypothetical protein
MVFEQVCGAFGPSGYLYFQGGRALIIEAPEGETVTGRRAKYGYFVNDGSKIPAIYDVASDFYEGFAFVFIDGRQRVIDETGSLMIWPEGVEMVSAFQDGIAKAREDGKYGFIDRDGGWVIQPEYDILQEFSEGCAAAGKDGKMGYIDINGEWLF